MYRLAKEEETIPLNMLSGPLIQFIRIMVGNNKGYRVHCDLIIS